jgi:hypothetical protein
MTAVEALLTSWDYRPNFEPAAGPGVIAEVWDERFLLV